MELIQIIVLALIQGVSEFLPVSSSAHLVLVSHFTEWSDQGLAFDAAVHAGTLAAVMVYFRHDLILLARSAGGRGDDADRRLLIALAIASVPALMVGALAAGWIETLLRSPLLIAVTTLVFGVLLGLADRLGTRRRGVGDIGVGSALLIGLSQVLALVPGTSRSGVTITAALALGLSREAAARFSFLLSIPIIAAAGGWGFLKGLSEGGRFEFGQFLLAAVIAGAFAWLTIAAFLAWLKRFGMLPFVIYRVVLGVFLLFWMRSN